jgi:hypothetical protein
MAPTKPEKKALARPTLDEIKAITLWMKDQKVASFGYGRLHVQFHERAHDVPKAPIAKAAARTEEEIEQAALQKFEETLFHSAGG